VDVLVGPQYSTLAIPAGAVAEFSQVPMIAPMASHADVTAGRRFVTRLAFLDDLQGKVLARFAHDSLGIRRAAVLYAAASQYGRQIAVVFDSAFRNVGGTSVTIERFDADEGTEQRPQLRRILAQRPDAILLPSFIGDVAVHIRVARELGFRGIFLAPDSWDIVPVIKSRMAIGGLVAANWDTRATREPSRRFVDRYVARYGEPPRAPGAAAYDAVHVLAIAAQRAGQRSGGALADSVRNLGRYEGVLSAFDFQGSGDPARSVFLLQITPDTFTVRAEVREP